jgi:hypothetical protein
MLAIATAVATIALVATAAFATNIPDVLYTPPKVVFEDQHEFATPEDASITVKGHRFLFHNPIGVAPNPDSDPGCDESSNVNYHCRTHGIKVLKATLGGGDDLLTVDLTPLEQKVKQVLKGGIGGDSITGGPGIQKEKGGDGNDTLNGGPGADILDGGPGTDECHGGPGRDLIKNCE